ncbi:MAG: SH3 domain-containing protein [Pseudomonadota bacterium]
MNLTALRRLAAGLLLVAPGALLAADPGALSRADSLRATPFADGKVVAPLASGAKVDILKRQGGWYQVKAGTRTGWVRMLSVRRATAAAGSDIKGLASVASGRAGTGTVSTTTGVRGLDAQDLATAEFNEEQVAKAETYRASAATATAFAKAGKLVVRDVPPLPDPAAQK